MNALIGCFFEKRKTSGALLTALLLFLGAFYFTVFTGAAMAHIPHPLHGAIFTTTDDGTVVNGNVQYESKPEVYLDGGPGINAPSTAAGLPYGFYYFQVTDPSGKDLLSSDHISCRKIHVNDEGVIDEVFAGTNYEYVNGQNGGWVEVDCHHVFNPDVDFGVDPNNLGAIVVQLYPFDDTPNPGGVYKAWITPMNHYACDPAASIPLGSGDKKFPINGENCLPGSFHGFIPAFSKTDNFKVKEPGKPFDAPELTVLKFHDANGNCRWDGRGEASGEEEITSWEIDILDPTPTLSMLFTPILIMPAPEGPYTIDEDEPAGTQQTVSILDGDLVSSDCEADQVSPVVAVSPTVMVTVEGTSGETHEVIYGDIGLGSITACKYFDIDGDGEVDPGEPLIEGWTFQLFEDADPDVHLPPDLTTDSLGCVTFGPLAPGDYIVKEVIPSGTTWQATGPTSVNVTIVSNLSYSSGGVPILAGDDKETEFTNVCTATADFGTKGFWHNKNGLTEIAGDLGVITYVNGLDPYDDPTPYFDNGDEPFDGEFDDGTDVDGAPGNWSEGLAGPGTVLAEVSHFLVDPNAGGDPKEQLAQQLLAFIFNSWLILPGPDTLIEKSPGVFVSAQSIIDAAVDAWSNGTAAEQNAMQEMLNALNNDNTVPFVPTAVSQCN